MESEIFIYRKSVLVVKTYWNWTGYIVMTRMCSEWTFSNIPQRHPYRTLFCLWSWCPVSPGRRHWMLAAECTSHTRPWPEPQWYLPQSARSPPGTQPSQAYTHCQPPRIQPWQIYTVFPLEHIHHRLTWNPPLNTTTTGLHTVSPHERQTWQINIFRPLEHNHHRLIQSAPENNHRRLTHSPPPETQPSQAYTVRPWITATTGLYLQSASWDTTMAV